MIFLRIIFLCWAVCGIHAVAGVRIVDVMTKNDVFSQALEMIGTRIKYSTSCREVTEELSREADKQEKRWREAFMSGAPTPQEWCQIAEFEAENFKKSLTDKGKKDQDKLVSLARLEEEGVISHQEAEKAMAALRRLLFVSKTAVDSLDDFIAGASLPLPASPDGDSYEKLVAWKLDPDNSLSYQMNHDPICGGCVEKTLEYCLNDRVMEFLYGTLVRACRERRAQLIREHADRRLEEAERFSRLPPLTPEQWCWIVKQGHGQEFLERSLADMIVAAIFMMGERKEGEDGTPVIDETSRYYWIETPEKIVRLWKEKALRESGR